MSGTAVQKAGRDSGGKFLAGNRVHKPARKKRVPRAILDEAVTDDALQHLIQLGMEKAAGGDDQWIGFFLQRYLPAVKPMSPKIAFPLDTSNPASAIQDILAAVAKGTVSSDQGKDLISSVQALAQVQEIATMQAEIDSIHQLLLAKS